MRRSALIGYVMLLVAGLALLACDAGPTISPGDAKAQVDSGALLLDVRTAEEFQGGHIEGAVNIPVGELEGRLAELPPPDQPIVVYCRSGRRSGSARTLLMERGFSQVHNLGAMSAWK